MNCVSHEEAAAYCARIGRRLPTAPELLRATAIAPNGAGKTVDTWTSTQGRLCPQPPCPRPTLERERALRDEYLVCGNGPDAAAATCRGVVEGPYAAYFDSDPTLQGIRCAN